MAIEIFNASGVLWKPCASMMGNFQSLLLEVSVEIKGFLLQIYNGKIPKYAISYSTNKVRITHDGKPHITIPCKNITYAVKKKIRDLYESVGSTAVTKKPESELEYIASPSSSISSQDCQWKRTWALLSPQERAKEVEIYTRSKYAFGIANSISIGFLHGKYAVEFDGERVTNMSPI